MRSSKRAAQKTSRLVCCYTKLSLNFIYMKIETVFLDRKKLSQDVIIFSFVYHLYFNIILILFQGFAALNREICRSRTLIILGYGFKNYNYFIFLTKQYVYIKILSMIFGCNSIWQCHLLFDLALKQLPQITRWKLICQIKYRLVDKYRYSLVG